MSLLKLAERKVAEPAKKNANDLLEIIDSIARIRDLDSLLERVLSEARRFVSADAGTIYLKSGDNLYFNYVQNDTFTNSEGAAAKYINSSVGMKADKKSLAGYVATTGEGLLIDDVYDIKSNVSFAFNASFDKKTAYRTKSILVVPMMTAEDISLGVLQLINAQDRFKKVISFSMQDRLYISQFARNAAYAIEKAKLSRELVFRMVEMAELRDPYETTQHTKRVAAYSIEIYQRYAEKHAVAADELKQTKDHLWTAAILHDVGKIAISDAILKKNGKLTYQERVDVRYHTIYGARLFRFTSSPWDLMASEVVLNHHERWDGNGYPGLIEDIFAEKVYLGVGKKGANIPLSARIVAVADVYDSLISKRAYKPAWEDENALKHIHMESGKHFDPEIVDILISIHDVIVAIRNKFPGGTSLSEVR